MTGTRVRARPRKVRDSRQIALWAQVGRGVISESLSIVHAHTGVEALPS